MSLPSALHFLSPAVQITLEQLPLKHVLPVLPQSTISSAPLPKGLHFLTMLPSQKVLPGLHDSVAHLPDWQTWPTPHAFLIQPWPSTLHLPIDAHDRHATAPGWHFCSMQTPSLQIRGLPAGELRLQLSAGSVPSPSAAHFSAWLPSQKAAPGVHTWSEQKACPVPLL